MLLTVVTSVSYTLAPQMGLGSTALLLRGGSSGLPEIPPELGKQDLNRTTVLGPAGSSIALLRSSWIEVLL